MKFKISKGFIVAALVVLLGSGYFFIYRPPKTSKVQAKEMVVYKEPTCQCCEFWAYYAKKSGYKVKIVNVENIEEIKKKYGVPASLQACHTAVVDGYVLEGHLPIEAVEKLLKEKPKVKGISLPGMPTGVPGMGGFKKGPLSVYEFDGKGEAREFYRF